MSLTNRFLIGIISSSIMALLMIIFIQYAVSGSFLDFAVDFDLVKLDPTQYRFTFTSILLALEDLQSYTSSYNDLITDSFNSLPSTFSGIQLSFDNFVENYGTYLTRGDLITLFSAIFAFIGTLIVGVGMIITYPFFMGLAFFGWIIQVFTGSYNIPVTEIPTYTIPDWTEVWDFTFNICNVLN